MAAGIVLPVSGPYAGSWFGLFLGTMNDDGYELSCTVQGQEVSETDAYGLTLCEAIYRGQNWRCRFRGIEWNRIGLLALHQMFGQVGGVAAFQPALFAVGNRWTADCLPLLLSSALGNPPASPAAITAVNAGLAPNSSTNYLITSKVREMPLELVLLPYVVVISSQTFVVPFTTQ